MNRLIRKYKCEPWEFRIVICSNFYGEATIVGKADTVEAATKRRRGLRQSLLRLASGKCAARGGREKVAEREGFGAA
jgi:hypothetical protein